MRKLSLAMLTGILLVSACNSAKKPSDANFRKAINQYLQAHGRACAWIGQAFPADVSESQPRSNFGIGSKMSVLEQAGLPQYPLSPITDAHAQHVDTVRLRAKFEP